MKQLTLIITVMLASSAFAQEPLWYFEAERLEYVEKPEQILWDLQGWYGGDEHKAWWKFEGENAQEGDDEAELQLLYSRAISPFWDLQLGLRHDFLVGDEETHAVIGFQGLAPQWFEIDAALFLNDSGDLSFRAEAEYDLLLTQKLILQPRAEFESGEDSFALGLRLRYEIRRELAPYVGVSWQDEQGEEDFVSIVVGARFWF